MAPNYDLLLPLLPNAELAICCFKPVSVKLYLLTPLEYQFETSQLI